VTVVTKETIRKTDDAILDGVLVDRVGGGVPAFLGTSLQILQNGKVQRYLMVAVVALMIISILKGVF
jgi:hypothetical protein